MPNYLDRLQDITNNRKLTELRQKIVGAFLTNLQLLQWLNSEAVKPFTDELEQDYLHDNPDAAKADFNDIAFHVATYNVYRLSRYTDPSPNKASWSVYDHVTRLLVQITKYDKENQGPCGWGETDDDVVTAEAYEVYILILTVFKEFHETE